MQEPLVFSRLCGRIGTERDFIGKVPPGAARAGRGCCSGGSFPHALGRIGQHDIFVIVLSRWGTHTYLPC
jgi:hypothetical protein